MTPTTFIIFLVFIQLVFKMYLDGKEMFIVGEWGVEDY